MLIEIVLALILSRICIYRFCNRLDGLTLCNARRVTFKPLAVKKNKVLVIYSVIYLCQFVVIVTRIRYYCCLSVFVTIRQLLFLFDLLHVSFEFCFDYCLKEKKNNSEPDPVQVFRSCITAIHQYLLATACSTPSSSRVNKHHTADSTDFVLV